MNLVGNIQSKLEIFLELDAEVRNTSDAFFCNEGSSDKHVEIKQDLKIYVQFCYKNVIVNHSFHVGNNAVLL